VALGDGCPAEALVEVVGAGGDVFDLPAAADGPGAVAVLADAQA